MGLGGREVSRRPGFFGSASFLERYSPILESDYQPPLDSPLLAVEQPTGPSLAAGQLLASALHQQMPGQPMRLDSGYCGEIWMMYAVVYVQKEREQLEEAVRACGAGRLSFSDDFDLFVALQHLRIRIQRFV